VICQHGAPETAHCASCEASAPRRLEHLWDVFLWNTWCRLVWRLKVARWSLLDR